MQYKKEVYVSRITNLSDARYAAGMMVDYVGFSLDGSMEGAIDETLFAAITGWIEGINIIGEFENLDLASINVLQAKYKLHGISIPYSRSVEFKEWTDSLVIVRVNEQELDSLAIPSNWLVQVESSGNLNISMLAQHKNAQQFIITGDVDQELLNQIADSEIRAVVLKGEEEERPGYKDYDSLADTLEYLEV